MSIDRGRNGLYLSHVSRVAFARLRLFSPEGELIPIVASVNRDPNENIENLGVKKIPCKFGNMKYFLKLKILPPRKKKRKGQQTL